MQLYAARYRFLRERDLTSTIEGAFIGSVPENVILTGDDADAAVDREMNK